MIYIQTLNNRQWNVGYEVFKSLGIKDKRLLSKFQEYIANEYVRAYVKAIDNQRFRMKWRPLTPAYLRYKSKHNLSTKIWEATGQIKKSLYVRKVGSRYCIGFDKRLNHKHSTIRLYRLAHVLEYGTLRIPPRPLFRYLYKYMSSHIHMYVDKFFKDNNIDITTKEVST